MSFAVSILFDRVIAPGSNDDLPEWVMLVPDGVVKTSKGTFLVDEAGAKAVIAKFAEREPELPIDYEHQTMGGPFASPDGTAPAAGWISAIEYRKGEGLFGKVRWLPKAARYLLESAYRYLSPVIAHETKPPFKIQEILSAALTNAPAIHNMAELVKLAASRFGGESMPDEPTNPVTTNQDEGGEADANPLEELMVKARALLELAEDATIEQILEAVVGLFSEGEGGGEGEGAVAAAKEIVKIRPMLTEALGVRRNASIPTIIGKIATLKAGDDSENAQLKARVEKLEADKNRAEAESLVKTYVAKGQVTAAQEKHLITLAMTDKDAAKAIMESAPQIPQGRETDPDKIDTETQTLKQATTEAARTYDNIETSTICDRVEWIRQALRDGGFDEAELDEDKFEEKVLALIG